mmetsp:Transcript_29137/g.69796  ORF Transcript_29137/g.69796 Transcript_29137/m.69796 type:complete len:258 (+) Transcript_29137:176-949(+)
MMRRQHSRRGASDFLLRLAFQLRDPWRVCLCRLQMQNSLNERPHSRAEFDDKLQELVVKPQPDLEEKRVCSHNPLTGSQHPRRRRCAHAAAAAAQRSARRGGGLEVEGVEEDDSEVAAGLVVGTRRGTAPPSGGARSHAQLSSSSSSSRRASKRSAAALSARPAPQTPPRAAPRRPSRTGSRPALRPREAAVQAHGPSGFTRWTCRGQRGWARREGVECEADAEHHRGWRGVMFWSVLWSTQSATLYALNKGTRLRG